MGVLPVLHLKDRIGWSHHVIRCVCGDGGRQRELLRRIMHNLYCVRVSKMRTYNTKYVVLFLPHTRPKKHSQICYLIIR